MRRRAFVGITVAALAGCSGTWLTDPRIKGTPQPQLAAVPSRPAGSDQALGLELAAAAVLNGSAAASWAGSDAARWRSLAEIRRRHAQVLATDQPLRREPGLAPSAAARATGSREAGLAAMTSALTAARDAELVLAAESSGVLAAFWAALAASAQQARTALTLPVSAARAGVVMRLVQAAGSWDAAANQVLARLHEAVYGVQSALGLLPTRHSWRPTVETLLTTLKTDRDALMAYLRTRSVSPDPGLGAYSLPPTSGEAKVSALLGGLIDALTQASAVWVASAGPEDRRRAADFLVAASGYGLPFGLGLAEYPGWPD